MIIVGIDAGGTKTKAVAYDCKKGFLGEGVSGPGNYHTVGLDKAVENIKEAIMKATNSRPDVVSMGVAGLDSKYDWEKFTPRVLSLAPKVIVQHDGVIALFSETLGNPGVVVIAGTGSVVEGYDGEKFIRIGGRGWLLSDDGSAYWIGRKALRKTLEMLDGIESKTPLLEKIMKKIGANDLDDLVHWAYNNSCKIDLIASIATVVDESANEGDVVAIKILKQGAEKLASRAVNLAKRIGVQKVYLKGGMFRSRLYLKFFTSYLEDYGIKGDVGNRNPEIGALVLGFREAGCDLSLLLNS